MINKEKSRTLLKLIDKYFSSFIDDENITEICYNGGNTIWTLDSHACWTSHESNFNFDSASTFHAALGSSQNVEVGKKNPILSATLPNGQRVQSILPNVTKDNHISITIRKPSTKRITLSDFEKQGIFKNTQKEQYKHSDDENKLLEYYKDKKYKEFITLATKVGKNIIIAGKTGSGKTTFMKSLIDYIPHHERLITIEDVEEIQFFEHKNYVQLFYPSEAKEGDSITSAKLLKSCLRMKPDRILLAELRGGETYDFINVVNSGHDGSITSCHAGSVEETFTRLELMTLMNENGQKIPHATITKILRDMVDIVVHMHASNGKRYITDIYYKEAKNKNEI